jgi:hypothetical protein
VETEITFAAVLYTACEVPHFVTVNDQADPEWSAPRTPVRLGQNLSFEEGV